MTRATTSDDLPIEAIAFLDALAIGESGGADDDMAYSVLYGGTHFGTLQTGPNDEPEMVAWPAGFPTWPGVRTMYGMTHAAGRYQFEPETWADLGGGSFDPIRQDGMAWKLACRGRPARLLAALASQSQAALAEIATELRTTWTSLSPRTFPERYAQCLAKLTTTAT